MIVAESPTTAENDVLVKLTSLNVEEAERKLIAKALERANNNKTRAADLLGMSVRTLRNKLNTPSDSGVSLAGSQAAKISE
jgi:DNA-binding NtrC family response regulator